MLDEVFQALIVQLCLIRPVCIVEGGEEACHRVRVGVLDSHHRVYDGFAHIFAGVANVVPMAPFWNDERVQLQRGTRKLQLKNAMQAKFDKILEPISKELMTPESMEHIKFDAFFANVMFHETAHGMGIKNTITGKGTVREALSNQYNALEEAKADVLGLYLVTKRVYQHHHGRQLHHIHGRSLPLGAFRCCQCPW